MTRATRFPAVLLLAAALLSACDSSGGQGPPALSPGINLSVVAPAAPLLQGASTGVTVNIARTGGFRGAVQVTADGAPAGVTIAPITIPADASSGTLDITASTDAAQADATITVRATAAGITERSTTFGLLVRVPPGFTLAADPPTLAIPQGGTATATLSIGRSGGFTGAVALSAAGVPAGVAVTFEPASATAATATVRVATTSAAEPGSHPITIRGVTGSTPERTTTLTVNVTPVPSFSIVASPTSLALPQGGSGTVSVTVTRRGGFAGPVVLTPQNLPAGVAAAAVTVPAAASTATLSFSASASAAPSSSAVTIRAAGSGAPDALATVALTIVQPGGFSLAVTPESVTLPRGGTATATAMIVRNSFTEAVALSASGAPEGMTVAFIPASTTGGQATVTLAAGAALAGGSYPIVLRGTAAGGAQQTATLTVNVPAGPSMSLAVSPPGLEVARGSTGTLAVNVTRGGGFAGAVNLTAENLPAGVTIAPATLAAGATSTSLTIGVSAAAALTTTTVTIRAAATGVGDATATFSLTVTQLPGYTLSLSPASIGVPAGGSGGATVNIGRETGFTDAVALSASGAPAGMTVAFNPSSATGNQATLTVTATAAVATGTYPITVRGSAPSLADRTATLSVQVTAPTGGNVTWRFCSDTGFPSWVAAQDGTGPWTRVAGAGNDYSFQVTTRGAIAYVVNNFGVFELYVEYATREELQAAGTARCATAGGSTRTINGTVVGMGATDVMAQVGMGNGYAVVVPAAGLGFQLQDVQPGPVDLLAARLGQTALGGLSTNRLFVQRGLNPPNDAAITVDFGGANSFAPATATLSLTNLGGDHAAVFSAYRTAGATELLLGFDMSPSAGTTRTFVGMPSQRQVAGDLHIVTAEASAPGEADPTHVREVAHVFSTLADRAFAFGPAMSPVQATVVTSQPYARLRLAYTVQTEYNRHFAANFWQDDRDATLQMTAGYLSGSSVVLEVPDFSGVAGWNHEWGLRAGEETVWSLRAEGWTAAGATPLNPWVDNAVYRAARRSGTLTP